jgi:phosphatidylinositol alpha-mannosyltransferase
MRIHGAAGIWGNALRLAIVSPYDWNVPSGVNSHISSLVGQLEQRGHDVWIIAPAGTLTRAARDLPEKFILAGRTIPVPSNGSIAHTSVYPFILQRFDRMYARERFDLVHVHEPHSPAVGSAAALAAKVPLVATFHAAGSASSAYERWRPLAARIHDCITVRIAVSEAARECVFSHFPDDYRVIPNGIDVQQYAPARSGKKVRGRILFLGRPEPRKGLAVLIEAFGKLREQLPCASLNLIGPTLEELQALLPRPNGNGADKLRGIQALGRLSHEGKIEQMRSAEVLCAPSLGGESFGIILTEAMAAGLPVVASDIPGYRAVMAEGAAGVLVPPGDATALQNALFNTLGNAELRRELTLGGIERAERYSWDRVANQVEEAYQDALALGPRTGEGPRVPVLKQARHFMRAWSPRSKKKLRAAGSQATS